MRFSISVVAFLSMLPHALPAFAQSVPETEPNDSPQAANSVVLGGKAIGHVAGRHEPDSVDYWRVEARAGETIHISVEACPECVDSRLDVILIGSDGVTQLKADVWGDGADPQLTYVASATGPYFVRAQEHGFGGANSYTLHFYARPCPDDPGERNETRETAASITLGSSVRAVWCPLVDRDFYKVHLETGTVLEYGIDQYVAGNSYNGGPRVYVFGPDGAAVDSMDMELGPARYTARTTGTHYIQPRHWGARTHVYTLRAHEAGHVPPGPGDPAIVRTDPAQTAYFHGLAVDERGDFWGSPNGNDALVRVSLNGPITRFNVPDLGGEVAWDPWGNMLTLHSQGVVRFAPPTRTQRLITFEGLGWSGLAVTEEAIWVSNAWSGPTLLRKYSIDGRLLESHHLSDVRAFTLVIGPSGDPHFAAGNAIYRFVAGRAELVLRREGPSEISGFAFDDPGNIYVSDVGQTCCDGLIGKARVALHDRTGAVVADSFSWWPQRPGRIVFGRDADGTTNKRLFVFDNGRLLELNSAGVRAPGLPVQPTGTCPVHASEAEPNDAPAGAHQIVIDTTVTGVSCMAGDADFFQFTAPRTQQLNLEVEGADQPTLELLASDGGRLAFSETPAARPAITHAVEAGSTYFVRVGSWFGGPNAYTLRVGTALGRPEGLTVAVAARELVRPNEILNSAQRRYLDQLGNNDGRYDVGDFRAFLRRERAASESRP